jgi:hypothetical protein
LALKKKCEEVSGETYNSCLLNFYHDGSEGMAYHSDGETDLKKHGAIASLTFGAERKFLFKHKTTKRKSRSIPGKRKFTNHERCDPGQLASQTSPYNKSKNSQSEPYFQNH